MQNQIQFLSAFVALIAAFIGYTTLLGAVRRFRSERAILIVNGWSETDRGDITIFIKNVGSRPALGVSVATDSDAVAPLTIDGIEPQGSANVVVPASQAITRLELEYRDADVRFSKLVKRFSDWNPPVLALLEKPSLARRAMDRLGVTNADETPSTGHR